MKSRYEATEMLYYEMVLIITWTDYVINNAVLRNIETEKNNCTYIKKIQLIFMKHIMSGFCRAPTSLLNVVE